MMREFPGSPVAKTFTFTARAGVQPSVGELRSHKPHGIAKKKKKGKKEINADDDIKQTSSWFRVTKYSWPDCQETENVTPKWEVWCFWTTQAQPWQRSAGILNSDDSVWLICSYFTFFIN